MAVSLIALMTIITLKAFILEDGFIVFRSIENFHLGFYFSAIADMRSQSFTSNLWTLLLLLGGYVSPNLMNVDIALSLGLTVITAVLVLNFFFTRGRYLLGAAGLLMLAASNTFTDYSTGGLENPLSHLILTLAFLYFYARNWMKIDFFLLCFFGACLTANRYDQILLVLPLLCTVFYQRHDWRRDSLLAVLGFLPLWLWMGFAWFYFGSIFPDTYFAKMQTGVPPIDRMNIAVMHHLRLLDMDFFGMCLLISVIGWGLYQGVVLSREGIRSRRLPDVAENKIKLLSIIAGVIFYNGYFFYAGGDYMVGRFMSVVMLTVVLTILLAIENGELTGNSLKWVAIIIVILCSVKSMSPNLFVPGYGIGSPDRITRAKTFDMRRFQQNWYFISQNPSAKDWRQLGYDKSLLADAAPYPFIVEDVSAGIIPFYAGPRYHLIDKLGLSDPLLSRLPCSVFGAAAHCLRNIPEGYNHFIQTGSLDQMDPDLARYVDALFKIKTLPLLDPERLRILVAFTLGHYDQFRLAYTSKHAADYYKPGDGWPLFHTAYNETILAPVLGLRHGQAKTNPLGW